MTQAYYCSHCGFEPKTRDAYDKHISVCDAPRPIAENIRGSSAMYHSNEMQFPVLILEARKVYGRVDALIQPIGGRGSKWVSALYLTDVKEPEPVTQWKPAID